MLSDTPLNATRTAGIGTLGGLEVEIETTRVVAPEVTLRTGDGVVEARWPARDWSTAEPSRLITAIERRIQRLDDDLTAERTGAERAATEAERSKARLGQPFEHAADLATARRRQLEIAELLTPAEPPPASLEPLSSPAPSLAR